MKDVNVESCGSIEEINNFIGYVKTRYDKIVKIINICSTPDGYDMFYYLEKEV